MKQKNKMKYFCISVVSVCTVIVIWFLCINVFDKICNNAEEHLRDYRENANEN